MTDDSRRQEMLAIIEDQANRKATETTTLRELEMDSLDNVELAFAFEDRFGITIDDDLWTDDTQPAQSSTM